MQVPTQGRDRSRHLKAAVEAGGGGREDNAHNGGGGLGAGECDGVGGGMRVQVQTLWPRD